MKVVDGIWFPDSELHLVEMLAKGPKIDGKGTYQYHKLDAALKYVKRRRCALDIGMHIGLWAMHLSKKFETVIGFEPVTEHIECLRKNMEGVKNFTVHQVAIGNKSGSVGLKFLNGSTGSTQIDDEGHGIPMLRLDDFVFRSVDFIKIDVENYEPFVVKGGEKTIKAHKPVIILEQKMNKASKHKLHYDKERYDARDMLLSWGARQHFDMNGDCCLSW